MRTFVYKKSRRNSLRKMARFAGLFASLIGLIMAMYTFFPLISYEVYIKPAFASQAFASPIPKTTIITQASIESLLKNTANEFRRLGDTNSKDWLPTGSQYKEVGVTAQLSNYYLSIPKLKIDNAYVSTTDNNVNNHLVHFPGTALPPTVGNATIFGHSTLPQLFDPHNYKTIFATALDLGAGDLINVTVNNKLFTYKIIDIRIVSAEDASYLAQDADGSYLTIITCTPPGTVWKRLVIKAKLETS